MERVQIDECIIGWMSLVFMWLFGGKCKGKVDKFLFMRGGRGDADFYQRLLKTISRLRGFEGGFNKNLGEMQFEQPPGHHCGSLAVPRDGGCDEKWCKTTSGSVERR